MPVHLKCLNPAQKLSCAISHIKGNLLLNPEIPGHFPRLTHIFRMRLYLFLRQGNPPFCSLLRQIAVLCRQRKRCLSVEIYIIPAEESVKLRRILSPCPCLYHQVRRMRSAENGLFLPVIGIAQEKLNKEGFFLPRFLISAGKGMPPPVVSLFSEPVRKHTFIPCNIRLRKSHTTPPFRRHF